MTPVDVVKPWRLIAGMPPLLYGGLLIVELPGSSTWLLVVAGVLLVAVVVASRLEYPLLPLWGIVNLILGQRNGLASSTQEETLQDRKGLY